MQTDRAAAIGAYAAVLWLILWTAFDLAAPSERGARHALRAGAADRVCGDVVESNGIVRCRRRGAGGLVGLVERHVDGAQQWIRLVDVVLVGAAAVGIAYVRVRREQQLARVTTIAETAQRAILPSLPAGTDGLRMAARYLSAAEDAVVGGDLYDCCLEGYTRVLVGDVRGKGFAAVEQAARVIRAFRQAAAAKQHLPDVASSMHTYLEPFFGPEEFATALLVECSSDSITLTSAGIRPPS